MDADHYRRKARTFLVLAGQITRPDDKAAMVKMAADWLDRAAKVDQDNHMDSKSRPRRERS